MNRDVRKALTSRLKLRIARGYAQRGEKWGIFRLLGYEPAFAAQRALHESRAPRRVVRFGRRGGKTLAAAVELTALLLRPGVRAWVVAPSHDLTERIWREVCRLVCDVLGAQPQRRSDSAPREITLPWGAYLAGKSTMPTAQASLLGDSLDAIVWDECALSPGSVWETRLQPNLADREGWALFTSTPEGYNHFYDKWMLTETDPDWEGFYAPTWANPHIPPTVIEEARRQFTPEAFAQAYEGKFTQLAGRVYPEFDEALHVTQLVYDPVLPIYVTFDFGTTEDSPFVCLWLQETPEDVIRVLRELVVANRSTLECGKLVAETHEEAGYPRAAWATGDPAARDARLTLEAHCPVLPRHGIFYRQHEIEAGIEQIRQRLWPLGSVGRGLRPAPCGSRRLPSVGRGFHPAPEVAGRGSPALQERPSEAAQPRLLIDPGCRQTIREFNLYRRREHVEGTDTQPRPVKEHDHCLDALRYYVMERPVRRRNGPRRRFMANRLAGEPAF